MHGFQVNIETLTTAGLSTAELMAVLSETQVDYDGAAVATTAWPPSLRASATADRPASNI
jgi:hypothetical protein